MPANTNNRIVSAATVVALSVCTLLVGAAVEAAGQPHTEFSSGPGRVGLLETTLRAGRRVSRAGGPPLEDRSFHDRESSYAVALVEAVGVKVVTAVCDNILRNAIKNGAPLR